MEKGEISRYEQFLLFPKCFQKTGTSDTKNQGLFGKGLKPLLTLSQMTNFKVFQTGTISDAFKLAGSSPIGKKILWEKEKLLVMSNFSFFQCFQDLYCRHVKTRACLGKVYVFLKVINNLGLLDKEFTFLYIFRLFCFWYSHLSSTDLQPWYFS